MEASISFLVLRYQDPIGLRRVVESKCTMCRTAESGTRKITVEWVSRQFSRYGRTPRQTYELYDFVNAR